VGIGYGLYLHICPRRELFSRFEKLGGSLMSMENDHRCRLVGKVTFRIKMYDGTMMGLKEVRYISYMTKLILVGALEEEGFRGILEEGILKMSSSSLVVLKGIRRNNAYYLMDSAVTELASSKQLDDNSTRLWYEGLGQVGLKSDQVLVGASTCDLESHDSCILDKKVKFGTVAHHLHDLLNCVHVDVGVLPRLYHLEAIDTVSIVNDYSRHCWIYPMR